MFIIRTAFWLGIIVMVMPSDPESQQRLKSAARDGIAHASTLCDRHQVACEKAQAGWSTFKTKAEAASRLAFSLAMEQMSGPRTAPAAGSAPAATEARPAVQKHGTLREDDLAPRWRTDTGRGRS